MADTKISALPAATTPLAGTEVLPIVQGGVTEKVAVDDLTVRNFRANATTGILQVTGPAAASTRVMTVPDASFTAARTDAAQSFTGDQTLSTGNLVIGTSGKGIDFSATPGTGTSELLDDYEEGTFTPYWFSDTGGEWPGKTTNSGFYTKVGRLVHIYGTVTYSAKAAGAAATLRVRGFPFTANPTNSGVPEVGFDNVIPDSGDYKIRVAATDLLFYAAGLLQGSGLIPLMPASGTYQFNFCIIV